MSRKRMRERPISAIGANLQRLRTASGMTQQEVAKGAGISRASPQRLEVGVETNPRYETLVGLANSLRCAVADLIAEPDDTPHPRGPAVRFLASDDWARVIDITKAEEVWLLSLPTCFWVGMDYDNEAVAELVLWRRHTNRRRCAATNHKER